MTKRRSPTTMPKRRRSQVLVEADQQQQLIQGFSILEREWQSFKSLKPRILCRPSTTSTADAVVKSLRLLNNSPRSLMSSLQVSVRSNDVAMEEIRRDRKAAIESGHLKGRRLFEEEEESETEVGFFGEREEMSSVTSYGNEGKGTLGRSKEEKVCCHSGLRLSSSSDEREDGRGVVGGEKVEEVNVDKVKRDEITFVNGGGGRWDVVTKGWFSMVLMVFAVGIFFMRCNGGYGVEDEVMLVPT